MLSGSCTLLDQQLIQYVSEFYITLAVWLVRLMENCQQVYTCMHISYNHYTVWCIVTIICLCLQYEVVWVHCNKSYSVLYGIVLFLYFTIDWCTWSGSIQEAVSAILLDPRAWHQRHGSLVHICNSSSSKTSSRITSKSDISFRCMIVPCFFFLP